MSDALAVQSDVESALLRPLTTTESEYIEDLLIKASALLRNAAPSVDARIARFDADSTDTGAIDPAVVSAVVAEAIKRYMVNPQGLATNSETVGPYSRNQQFALRSEKTSRGVLQITPDDLAVIFPTRKRLRAGTIRTRPALAPRPVGRYGPLPSLEEAVEAVTTYSDDPITGIEALDARYGPLYPGGA